MKIIAIGDIHGRDLWKKIVLKEEDAGKVIFIGDYFDGFDGSSEDMLKNYEEIVDFKERNGEDVILLLGNHDFHYMKESGDDRYSGYRGDRAKEFQAVLEKTKHLLQVVHTEPGFIFSHAGITNTWLGDMPLGEVNDVDYGLLKFSREDTSGFGQHVAQSPIWVRPESLLKDFYGTDVQVVGHTQQKGVTYLDDKLTLIDCHDRCEEYLVIEDGKAVVESL